MEQYNSSARHHVFSVVTFLTAVALIAACFFDFNYQVRLNLLRDTRAQAEAIGVNAVRLLENEVGYLKNLTYTASMLMDESEFQDEGWLLEELGRYAERGSIVRALFVTLDGQLYTSYAGYLGTSHFTINGIPTSEIKEPIVVPAFYAEDLQQPVFGVAAPATLGGRQGVLVSSYNVEQFKNLFENRFAGGDITIGIIRRNGSVILGQPYKDRPTAFGIDIFEAYRKFGTQFTIGSVEEIQSDLAAGGPGYASYSFDGEERYLSYLPTDINDWYVAVLVPERALRPQAYAIQKNGILLTLKLTAVMAGLMAIIFVIRRREEMGIRKLLMEAAMLDGLTRLYNRNTTEETLTKFFELEDGSASHALFVIDVDSFKLINDTYGHLYGDDVLAAIAGHLRTLFGSEAVLGRMGGDEFIALYRNCKDGDAVLNRAAEVAESFFTHAGRGTPPITVSMGIALYPADGTSFLTLYQKADKALYNTKRQGKNGFTFYQAEQGSADAPPPSPKF